MALVSELVSIPMLASSSRVDIYSGVQRLMGRIYGQLVRPDDRPSKTALIITHPAAAFLGHYLLRPLADACGLVIDGSYESREFAQLASKVLHDPRFDGSRIVVAWTHKELPTLASALGAPRRTFPKVWGDDVYDLCFQLSYKKNAKPTVRRFQHPF